MKYLLILITFCSIIGCSNNNRKEASPTLDNKTRIPVILDTDANNELDDQHALAYLFFNSEYFDTKGITVNTTINGGDINGHYDEAARVMHLCDVKGKYPIFKGANADFSEIKTTLNEEEYDGSEAVEFIIDQAIKHTDGKLILVPIGKLTNIALALKKEPEIKEKVEIVWLGANYPAPGEYNLDNDTSALNYILDQNVKFDMVMVRYGEDSGSDAVKVTPVDIANRMANAGPEVEPISGRHGGEFTNFGSYSQNLFSKIDLHGDPPSWSLFDVVALAVLKNPDWGAFKQIPAPIYSSEGWKENQENERLIGIWENFDKEAILNDFFNSMNKIK